MAIGTPVEIARGHTSAVQASLAVTLATAVSAGDLIVVVAVNHNTGTVVANSCVDSVGANTYTRITVANAGGSSALLAYCGGAQALSGGATITVGYPSTRNIAIIAFKISGASATPFDKSATAAPTTNTALSVGPTAATTQAAEIALACFTHTGTHTYTATGGYTQSAAKEESTTTIRGVWMEHKILSATGAQTATATLNSTSVYCGIIATFKEASSSTFNEAGQGTGITNASGADAESFTEAGSGAEIGVASGADTTAAADAGQGVVIPVASGADALTNAAAGQATAAQTGSGADAQTFADAGGAAIITVASGADTTVSADAGAGIMPTIASGDDTFSGAAAYNEAGQGAAAFAASGADAMTFTDAATALMGGVASGADALLMVESGNGVLVAAGGGLDTIGGAATYNEAGQSDAILVGAGADAFVMDDAGGGVGVAVGGGADAPAIVIASVIYLDLAYRYDADGATGGIFGATVLDGIAHDLATGRIVGATVLAGAVGDSPIGHIAGARLLAVALQQSSPIGAIIGGTLLQRDHTYD